MKKLSKKDIKDSLIIYFKDIANSSNNELDCKIVPCNTDLYEMYIPEFLENSYWNHKSSDFIIHNDKGPALILKDNYNKIIREEYFSNGYNHRIDGPAIYEYKARFYNENYYMFIINGKVQTDFSFAIQTNHLRCKSCNKFCKQKCF